MASRPTVTLCTAPAGSGKSFLIVKEIVDQVIPDTQDTIITNLPLEVEAIAEYCSKLYNLDPEDIMERIEIIPHDALKDWKSDTKGDFGPWEFFEGKSIQDCYIIIDEIHNFAGMNKKKALRQKWQEWLGELRHQGATFLGISQHEAKIAKEIIHECAERVYLDSSKTMRDPYFNVVINDWTELACSWLPFFQWREFVYKDIIRKKDKREERTHRTAFIIEPKYFPLYDSFSAPIANNAQVKAEEFKHEYQKRGRLSLTMWFVNRNFTSLVFSKFTKYAAILMFCLFGGIPYVFGRIQNATNRAVKLTPAQNSLNKKASAKTDIKPEPMNKTSHPRAESKTLTKKESNEQRQLQMLSQENADLRKKQKDLEERLLQKNLIQILTPNSIQLATGKTYSIGDEIELIQANENKKATLCEINWEERTATLSDGSSLQLQ